jgi:hypothetical protein
MLHLSGVRQSTCLISTSFSPDFLLSRFLPGGNIPADLDHLWTSLYDARKTSVAPHRSRL